jgi:hypothetical protein
MEVMELQIQELPDLMARALNPDVDNILILSLFFKALKGSLLNSLGPNTQV